MTTHVVLGGGLGNQMFQLAAGLYASNGQNVVLETGILTPNQVPTSELSRFSWPKNVALRDARKCSAFEKRFISLCIRQGAANHSLYFHKGLETLATISISFLRRKFFKVFINRGVGYDERLSSSASNRILIGYFQCHQWPEATREVFQRCLDDLNEEIPHDNIQELLGSNFNLLHIRLGDYLNENSFGVPGVEYFKSSLDFVDAHSKNKSDEKLMIFSDSPDLVPDYLDTDTLNRGVVFKSKEFGPAQTLFLMSKANNFIISNSTFSWWAAFLSKEIDAVVVSPNPWFAVIDSPIGLIPEKWIRLDSAFQP